MLIKVKVFPNSKKEKIIEKSENSFEIWVKEKPVKGQANRAVTNLLSDYFNKSKKIKLVKGFKKKNKIFSIN